LPSTATGATRAGPDPRRAGNLEGDVIAQAAPASPADDEWAAAHRLWAGGWRRLLLGVLPMLYLLYVVGAVHQYARGASAAAGYALLMLFAVGWLFLSLTMLNLSQARFWSLYGLLLVLVIAELPFARGAGFTMCTFLTITTVARLQARSAPVVAAFAVSALLVPVAVPSWHVSLGESFGMVNPVAIPVVGPDPGAQRGRAAGRRERAHPDRPRPARPARPLADDDHGQSRACPPGRRG
jgi:hypothetical protein